MSQLNVFGKDLELCSSDPMTGAYRTGCCETGPDDIGTHTVCAIVTDKFLEFYKKRGNELTKDIQYYNFKGLNNLTSTYSNSLYRYYYGEFNTYSQAKSYLSFVKKKGYKGAYIKGFKNGIEINISSKMKKD